MTVQEIISNAFDLAGGSLVREKLDYHQGVLACLNILQAMSLELSNSGKATAGFYEDFTLAGGAEDGSFTPQNTFSTDKKIILTRSGADSVWQVLPFATSYEGLTEAAKAGQRRILWTGSAAPFRYFLSWSPSENLNARIWVKTSWRTVTNLTDSAPTPQDLDLVAVYRLVGYFLNQLLLMDAAKYQPFVVAQTGLIERERRRLDHIWRVYLAEPPDAGQIHRAAPYEMADEWGETFDTGVNTIFWQP